MPHIKDADKDTLHNTHNATKEGELCFLFAEGALAEYNKEPRWSSIHKIKRALRNPYHAEWSHELVKTYMGGYDRQDIETAADLAFMEFYRIIGAKYEDHMIAQNGSCFKDAIFPVTTVVKQLDAVQQSMSVLTPPTPVTTDSKGDLMPDHTVEQCVASEPHSCFEGQPVLVVKKRGRPAGSKNKVA